jgi:PAS domain S-box-containing protein
VVVQWQDNPVGELILEIDMTSLNDQLLRQIGFLLISTFIAVLVAGLLVQWVSHTLTKPLPHLSDVAQRISCQDNFSLRAETNLNRDEVSQLTDNFNRMLEHIEKQDNYLHQQQDILYASEQRLLLATASAGLGVWDLDLRADSMDWDDRMFEMYGITRSASSNNLEVWLNSLHPKDKEQAVEEYQAALQGVKEFDTVFRILRPDGSLKYIKANAIIIRGANGDAERMLGVNADVTKREQTMQSCSGWS